jgi:hypothetical protein
MESFNPRCSNNHRSSSLLPVEFAVSNDLESDVDLALTRFTSQSGMISGPKSKYSSEINASRRLLDRGLKLQIPPKKCNLPSLVITTKSLRRAAPHIPCRIACSIKLPARRSPSRLFASDTLH